MTAPALVAMVALACTGCGFAKSCDKLADQLCAGRDAASCNRVRAWLDGRMRQLTEREAERACEGILDSDDQLRTWRSSAERALARPAP